MQHSYGGNLPRNSYSGDYPGSPPDYGLCSGKGMDYATVANPICNPHPTLGEVIAWQAPTDDGWVCPHCKHWGGDIDYHLNVFISTVGANLSRCTVFEKK